ncbi:UNVERIFIED_CONTAM: hypothetical protein FKN15_050094 [Acipenser sinensis]
MAAYLTTDWTSAFLKKRILFSTAFLIRIVLVFYGVYQDKTMLVKYTDIDYHVFTDASRFITQGSSPYKRATYRYTPLLAWILIPNIYLTALFGKLLFVICDVISAYLMYRILHFRGMGNDKACWYCALWLLNPLPIAVSSRGNAESVLVVLVVATLYYMENRSLVKAAVCYGLSVHMKIYPVTYALPIALSLQTLKDPETEALGNKASSLLSKRIQKFFSRLLNRDLLVFAVIAGGTFFALSLIFYSIQTKDELVLGLEVGNDERPPVTETEVKDPLEAYTMEDVKFVLGLVTRDIIGNLQIEISEKCKAQEETYIVRMDRLKNS